MRKFALVVAVLGLVGLGVLLSRRERASSPTAGPVVVPEQSVRSEPAALVPAELPHADGESRTPVAQPRAPARAARRARSQAPSQAQSPSAMVRLNGTIVVVDEFGIEHTAESGSFYLSLDGVTNDNSEVANEIEVRGGVWSTEFSSDDLGKDVNGLSVSECSLRGRAAVPVEGRNHLFKRPEDGRLALRVRWIDDVVLHVRARESGRELEEVWLHELPSWDRASKLERPGLREKGELAGPSPLRIAPLSDSFVAKRVFHAWSPGYAWGRIEFDASEAKDLELLLVPSGELEIVLAGESRDPATRVELFRADGLPGYGFLDQEIGKSPSILVEDLPAGSYVVQAHWGPQAPILVGSANADVVAGERSRVFLTLAQFNAAADVPFGGVLVLPEEWGLRGFQLFFARQGAGGPSGSIDRSKMTVETPGRFRWSAPPIPAGRYLAGIGELGFSVLLETGTTGTLDARIEVPPPCSVTVRAVDAASGAPLDGRSWSVMSIWWTCPSRAAGWLGDFDEFGWSRVGMVWNPEQKGWSARVPQGAVKFEAMPGGYECRTNVVVLGPGENEVVLEMKKR